MIIFSSDTVGFIQSVERNKIADEIEEAYIFNLGRRPSPSEKRSWNNSMQFMGNTIRNSKVADDCGILIEYNVPSTSRRIDFLITGKDENNNYNYVIVELKQWESAEATNKNDIVFAYNNDHTHPSYQAWSYLQMLEGMNEAIYMNNFQGHCCAYLHNYPERNPEPLKQLNYQEIIKESPLFLKADYEILQEFLYKYVGKGKGKQMLYEIENGRIRPSKKLIDYVDGLLKGNKEFTLLEEQKVAYELIMDFALNQDMKRTIIVHGGPGTGKSVISLNVFGEIIKNKLNAQFVAPNAAFRKVVLETLVKQNVKDKGKIRNLFAGSSKFFDAEENIFNVLVVDEAHRLKNDKAYMYRGENQIEDIIKASKINVFFIDDTQRIRPEDIGTVEEIKRIAGKHKSKVEEVTLNTQFRCSGAEGFINWIEDTLHIRQTGNYNGWDRNQFEFEIFDSPNEVYAKIQEKVKYNFKARMLAGYAWPWTKEGNRNGEVKDVEISEYDFSMPWNGRDFSETWAIESKGINQVGCVHSSQGLEFDYVGVIIGNDLKFDPEKMELYADYSEYKDSAGKKGLKNDPERLTEYIKNIYRILISRGMKGCYVFCRDENLKQHFLERLEIAGGNEQGIGKKLLPLEDEINERIETNINDEDKYEKYLPVYSLKAVATTFNREDVVEQTGWMRVEGLLRLEEDMFIAQVVGKSMEPTIIDGRYCIFRSARSGSRSGKIVLVESRLVSDPETFQSYTIKIYRSSKEVNEDGTWCHKKIILSPANLEFDDIILENVSEDDFRVIAEFVSVV